MRVLVACEVSGVVRDAFRAKGHEAYSVDVKGVDSPYHIQGDARDHLTGLWKAGPGWDLLIAHPPCTYLCNSGVWALTRTPPHPSSGVLYGHQRREAMREAAELFNALLDAPIPRIALENPLMHRYARDLIWTPYTQVIQPHHFGEDASKATCLWLKNLPPLMATGMVAPRWVGGKPRWGNQTNGGQNKLTPSPERGAARAVTYPGIAEAMAIQWGEQ